MNEFFAKLKRLLEPRPRPPAENVGEPTADRPPPPAAEPPPVEAAPSREPVSFDVDELAEVRAALEAVAEVPVSAAEPEAEVLPPAHDPTPAPAPIPALTLAPPPKLEAVDVPGPASERIGDALVLTLATPAATFTVAKSSATLGRGQENTIRLDDLSVSRRHARIAYRQGGYWLSDLGSMGGTWVDGTRLNAPRRIAAGEVIDIGLCRLTASFSVGAARAETKKSASKRSEMAGQARRRQ